MYDERFFAEQVPVALAGARAILPQVIADTGAKKVIDIGCGVAAWASVAESLGCYVIGVDGHVPESALLIDRSRFGIWDLNTTYHCINYDLAICLEVAEHLPESSAATLVKGLCYAPYVLFSAAHPGQGGVNHINEQWSSYWAAHFAKHGYVGSCDIRDRHWHDDSIEKFYRENVLLFSTPERLAAIGYSQSIRDEVHPSRGL